MRQQQVHLGITQSGVPGLFTGHTLAMHLTPEQYNTFKTNRVALEAYCKQIGFVLESATN